MLSINSRQHLIHKKYETLRGLVEMDIEEVNFEGIPEPLERCRLRRRELLKELAEVDRNLETIGEAEADAEVRWLAEWDRQADDDSHRPLAL